MGDAFTAAQLAGRADICGAAVMTVYVDDMRVPFGRWLMCHMIADTAGELHEMAAAIGVGPRWFHRGDHYDINWTQRAEAVKRGAVEAPRRFVARRVAVMRGKQG